MRREYLSLLGIQTYRARSPLPGAAPGPIAPELPAVAVPSAPIRRRPTLPTVDAGAHRPAARRETVAGPPPTPSTGAPRFQLMAIAAGPWLWLEQLAGEQPAPEQLRLVEAMSEALLRADNAGVDPERRGQRSHRVIFRWPLHGNDQQFDQGPAAAAAALRAFVLRQLEERGCRAVVLLGEDSRARLAPDALEGIPLVATAGTAEMLSQPIIKRRVWQDLQALLARR